MKKLLLLTILAFSIWITSELIEIVIGGYNATVYYLTSVYHVLAGFGIWGIHRLRVQDGNLLSFLSTILISISFFMLAYFPIQVLHSGSSVSEFLTVNPYYAIPGFLSLIGFVLLGIANIRTKFFPPWTGWLIIICTTIYAVSMSWQLQLLINIANIALAATIIYMCLFGLKSRTNLR